MTFHLKNDQSVTCQCNTPFLTQGSEEQKCTKRASVQPLVYLYLYVYRYVWQIYSCKEDRILYRLTFHLSVTCQCNTPFLTQGSEEQKCTKRASVQPLVYLYLYVYRYVSYLSMQHPFFNALARRKLRFLMLKLMTTLSP